MKYLGKIKDNKDLITKEGVLIPNFDNLTPIATYTYSIAAAAYYKMASRANSALADIAEFDDVLMFRITVTGTGINQVADVIVMGSRALANPIVIAHNRTLSTSAATTGIRYLRFNYPKTMNNGYGWDIEFYAYNATARTVKVEVFATTENYSWYDTLTATGYNSDYQSTASMALYTSRGFCYLGTAPIAVSSASTSTYITGYLPLFIAGTQPTAGEALKANSLILFSNNKAYKASNKTVAITPEIGLAFLSNATSSGSALTYNYVRQKGSWATLTGDSAMGKATIERGNPVYLRCTLTNGNIYSDAYLSTSMAAGYTWCYVGVAQSSTAINVETTHPLFITLDSNSKITHINGKALNVGVASVNGQTGDVTVTVPDASSANPQMNGTAAAGSSTDYSRADHVHPSDISKQDTLTFDSTPTNNSANPVTSGGIYNLIHYTSGENFDYVDIGNDSGILKLHGDSGYLRPAYNNKDLALYSDVTDKYVKPSGGIPKSDLASGVQSSLDAADSAYQKPSGGIPASDLASGVIPSVPSAYTSNPAMDGTASAGSSSAWAKGDHVHPSDTTKANVTTVAASASINSSGLITFKNSSNTSLFTLQLPLYNGGVS